MLRITQLTSARGAKSYYSHSDYLSEGQELTGRWFGLGAEMLGLKGDVEKKEFSRLCDNLHPFENKQLTMRTNTGRTVGYDFNFHAPKSVSIAYEVLGDDRILEAFNDAVDETMSEVEQDAATRVRKHYADTNRNVGNLTWAKFVHKTARPVDGIPDPHLHAHAFVFNSVFDAKENVWKAGQFRDIKRDACYFEAAFHARLAKNIKELGYSIERRGKFWDLANVRECVNDKFSRRKDLVEKLAREGEIENPAIKASLAGDNRETKTSDLTMPELQKIWKSWLSDEEIAAINSITSEPFVDRSKESLRYAINHTFERESVVPKRKLMAESLRFGVGDVTVEGIAQQLESQKVIVRAFNGREMATTPVVLAEERAMLDFIKRTRNSVEPLVENYKPKREWLNQDQSNAVKSILSSRDRVQLIRGGAGTGKTSLMSEAVEPIEASGTKVFAFAPSAEASRGVLASEGFNATTVAELLVNEKLQAEVARSVLWIDEAGLLSSGQLRQVVEIADRQHCRVILSGDPKQHKSVQRGDVLRLLEDEKAVNQILVQQIQRQTGDYREVVEHLSKGRTERGIEELGKLGWIHEIPDKDQRLQTVAADYADQFKKKKSTLVVTPTRAEAQAITNSIRGELQRRKLIGKKIREVYQLVPRHLTEGERSDPSVYQPNDVLVFHQNLPGITRGETVKANPEIVAKAIQYPDRFSVYRESMVDISKGDLIRITRGGKSLDGEHRIYNGNQFKFKRFDRNGNLVLENGWKLARDFGHISHGYTTTSHSSQGKTVDNVMLVESSMSFPAASKEQLYVSISRGRKTAKVYTDNLEDFKHAVSQSDERISAIDLMKQRDQQNKKRKQQHAQRVMKETEQRTAIRPQNELSR